MASGDLAEWFRQAWRGGGDPPGPRSAWHGLALQAGVNTLQCGEMSDAHSNISKLFSLASRCSTMKPTSGSVHSLPSTAMAPGLGSCAVPACPNIPLLPHPPHPGPDKGVGPGGGWAPPPGHFVRLQAYTWQNVTNTWQCWYKFLMILSFLHCQILTPYEVSPPGAVSALQQPLDTTVNHCNVTLRNQILA